MRIRNKVESLEKIKELGLNQLPEIYLNCLDKEKIKNFLNNNQAEYYAVRDRSVAMSPKFSLAVPFKDVIDYCIKNELEQFSINISSYNYRAYQICWAEVCIHDDNRIDYIATNNPNASSRDCYREPDYNGTTNIFDKKLSYIKGFDKIVDYIYKYNLFNVIVEASSFSCLLGTKNEDVLVWELRTDY